MFGLSLVLPLHRMGFHDETDPLCKISPSTRIRGKVLIPSSHFRLPHPIIPPNHLHCSRRRRRRRRHLVRPVSASAKMRSGT